MNITHEDGGTVIENESRTVEMYWNKFGRFCIAVRECRSKPGSCGGDETDDFVDMEPQEMMAIAAAIAREARAFAGEQADAYKAAKRGAK